MGLFSFDRRNDGLKRGQEKFSAAAKEEAGKKRLTARENGVSYRCEGCGFKTTDKGAALAHHSGPKHESGEAKMGSPEENGKHNVVYDIRNGFSPKEPEPYGVRSVDTQQKTEGEVENTDSSATGFASAEKTTTAHRSDELENADIPCSTCGAPSGSIAGSDIEKCDSCGKKGHLTMMRLDLENAAENAAENADESVLKKKSYSKAEFEQVPHRKGADGKTAVTDDGSRFVYDDRFEHWAQTMGGKQNSVDLSPSWLAASLDERAAWLEQAGQDINLASDENWNHLSLEVQMALGNEKERAKTRNNSDDDARKTWDKMASEERHEAYRKATGLDKGGPNDFMLGAWQSLDARERTALSKTLSNASTDYGNRAPEFIAWVKQVASANGKSESEVFKMWQDYSTLSYDQSALTSEFMDANRLKGTDMHGRPSRAQEGFKNALENYDPACETCPICKEKLSQQSGVAGVSSPDYESRLRGHLQYAHDLSGGHSETILGLVKSRGDVAGYLKSSGIRENAAPGHLTKDGKTIDEISKEVTGKAYRDLQDDGPAQEEVMRAFEIRGGVAQQAFENADSDFRVVEEASDDFAIFRGGKKVREGLHKSEVEGAMAEEKHMAFKNAGPQSACPGCQNKVDKDEMMVCDECNTRFCPDCVKMKGGELLCKACEKAGRKNAFGDDAKAIKAEVDKLDAKGAQRTTQEQDRLEELQKKYIGLHEHANAAPSRFTFVDNAGAEESVEASSETEAWTELAQRMNASPEEMKGAGIKLKNAAVAPSHLEEDEADLLEIERHAEGVEHEVREMLEKDESEGSSPLVNRDISKSEVSEEISHHTKEKGMPQDQAVAVAFREAGVAKNSEGAIDPRERRNAGTV